MPKKQTYYLSLIIEAIPIGRPTPLSTWEINLTGGMTREELLTALAKYADDDQIAKAIQSIDSKLGA